MTTGFVLAAFNRKICQSCPENGGGLVNHSDCGSQRLSIKYNGRLAETGIDLWWAVSATAMITPWLKASLACSKQRLSTVWEHGSAWAKSIGKPWFGSVGTTQSAYTAPSDTSRHKKQTSILCKFDKETYIFTKQSLEKPGRFKLA